MVKLNVAKIQKEFEVRSTFDFFTVLENCVAIYLFVEDLTNTSIFSTFADYK